MVSCRRTRWAILGSVALLASALMFTAPKTVAQRKPKAAPRRVIDYNRDVRPILSENCFACHGPAARSGKGDLRLDDVTSARKDRGGASAIVPYRPDDSLLIDVISTDDERDQMPPKASGKPRLRPDEIETLRLWIQQGAKVDKHWAFVPPTAPAIPPVKRREWVRNPVDAFVLARLESAKLSPADPAPKTTLLRRVSLTLTGLLPTPAELAEFLADDKPGAYERAVDRYLASPRYGEHQARYWLDAVRYGDTHGLHFDNERAIYPYRDWIVNQYNADLPFAKFTEWQLAGDMLPHPSQEMLTATGYIRMNPTTNEGGVIEAEFLAKNTFDRVDTTGTVFLGLTVACARCHDHKYDAVSQKDYYSLYAFFNSTTDAPLDGNALAPDPVIKAPSPSQLMEEARLKQEVAAKLAQVPLVPARQWLERQAPQAVVATNWQISKVFPHPNFDAAFDGEALAESEAENAESSAGWKRLEYAPGSDLTSIIRQDNASVYLRAELISETDGEYDFEVVHDDGIKVWIDGVLVHQSRAFRSFDSPEKFKAKIKSGSQKLLIKLVNEGGGDGIRITWGDPRSLTIGALRLERESPAAAEKIKAAYLAYGPESALARSYREAVRDLSDLRASIPSTLIAREMDKPRPAYILRRGEYDAPGEKVDRAIPAVFGSMNPGLPKNRLGLAKWLSDPKNPIVGRVLVNRIWQQHFGTGIVKTAEDFGNQGEWPSHPELLDWLTLEFHRGGGSLKKLHRLIVTSNAFRQSSVITAQGRKVDPENRLISRGPRFRLDAEVIRDQALQVSGRLVNRPGGAGFRPYQPEGLWEAIAFPGSTTSKYVQDLSDSIYRRSLYMFWKRTSPHPVVLAFDAPMREMCAVRRGRTNTPLQALVTMNEPMFVECSRLLGEQIMKAKRTDADRIAYAFRRTLSRNPSPKELALLLSALSEHRSDFKARPSDAAGILQVGMTPPDKTLDPAELAAWTMIGNTLINLDEFLTQH